MKNGESNDALRQEVLLLNNAKKVLNYAHVYLECFLKVLAQNMHAILL